jgi:hypothetical protein
MENLPLKDKNVFAMQNKCLKYFPGSGSVVYKDPALQGKKKITS